MKEEIREIKKMLVAIINGQSSMKAELLEKISKIDIKVEEYRKENMDEHERTHKRLDKIGKAVAHLEDDTPIREEFDNLEQKVDKYIASA